jgi:succinate dehydrogenase / fumarate reductase flavoprotein subunit
MFDDIPEPYRNQTATDEEEGWRYTQGDKSAKRPPELLTRDHVARCIMREVKAGRGSPHGGVFLDIAWIKKKLSGAEAHIKRKLPSMYHQFKELGDIDITKEPMEVGPTTHYIMGGIPRDGDTQMSSIPGALRRRRVRGGHQRRQPPRRQLAVGPARLRQARGRIRGSVHRRNTRAAASTTRRRDARSDAALEPFENGLRGGENPFTIQAALQEMMQSHVGIVRLEARCSTALQEIDALRARGGGGRRDGPPEYNNGWHTAIDLRNLLTVSEAIARSAIERKESRGGHFRDDYPDKNPEYAKFNIVTRRAADGSMDVVRVPLPPMPPELQADHRGTEGVG